MRLAILSDIHGNSPALDAVLADLRAAGGADAHWVLGDFAAVGYDPVGALARVAALPNARFVRGNTDRHIAADTRPGPTVEQVQADPSLAPLAFTLARAFAWTTGQVRAAGWFDWIAALPLEQRLTLPDGTRLLGVHAAPGQDDGDGIRPTHDDTYLAGLVADCQADLVCVGHTHWPLDRQVGATRIVNLGSVSNPFAPDTRASYVLLEADATGYTLQHRRVAYDTEAAIAAMEAVAFPASAMVARLLRGQQPPPWAPR